LGPPGYEQRITTLPKATPSTKDNVNFPTQLSKRLPYVLPGRAASLSMRVRVIFHSGLKTQGYVVIGENDIRTHEHIVTKTTP